MTKVYCDRCGNEINGEEFEFSFPVFSAPQNKWKKYQFCEKCARDFGREICQIMSEKSKVGGKEK